MRIALTDLRDIKTWASDESGTDFIDKLIREVCPSPSDCLFKSMLLPMALNGHCSYKLIREVCPSASDCLKTQNSACGFLWPF